MADAQEYNDVIVTFEGGVNLGDDPYILPKDVLTKSINISIRGGFVTPRSPFQKINLNFGGNTDVQNAVQSGTFQGMCYYAPNSGSETLMAAISGRLFQFTPATNTATATVVERTIPGDPNPSDIPIAWMWPSENFVIWNDGSSIPVFFDGTVSRRSNTQSVQLGVASADFVVPAIGESVTITLAAAYTGPIPATIFIDNATYQTELDPSGYQVILKNLYDTPGTVHNIGEQYVIEPVNLGYMTNTQPIPAGTYAAGTLTLTLVMSAPVTAALIGKKVLVNSSQWNISAVSVPFQEILVKNVSTFHGGVTYNPGSLVSFVGSVPPNTVLGQIVSASFTAPAIGSTVNAQMNVPFTGTPNTVIFIGNGQYSITGTPVPPPGLTLTVVNINDAVGTGGNQNVRGPGPPGAGQTLVGPGILFSMPELPTGRMGAYGMGRNWISLTDGREFIGGDIVGGPSGTPSLKNRDSVLRVTENLFLAGGGTFTVPGNPGSITSMTFSAVLDASLGQGALQVGTPNGFFSVNTPVVREVWANITNPILTEPMLAPGPLGQDSTDNSNSDIMFRSTFGAGSLMLARRDFNEWGNTPISHEVDPIFNADDKTLLIYGSSIQFDNRRLYATTPTQGPQGVYHKSLLSIQLDAISSLRGKSPSCWESQWTGLNIFRMRQGMFNGVRRAFAFCYSANAGEIELWEILPESSTITADNGVTPIVSIFETPLLFKPDPSVVNPPFMRLLNGELVCDQLVGRVDFRVQFRSDSDPCWHDWHNWSVCASAPNPLSPLPQSANLQPQYRKPMGFGSPPADGCDETTGKPWREGFWFQARFIIQGSYRMVRARFQATEIPRPKVAPQICGDEPTKT